MSVHRSDPSREPTPGRARLAVEFAGLFGLAPLAAAWWTPRFSLLPALWLAALGCGLWLWGAAPPGGEALKGPPEDAHGGRGSAWRTMAWRGLAMAVFLTAFVQLLRPGQLFWLPRHAPRLWGLILLLYPLLSALPQEVVYRIFFFRRYRTVFVSDRAMLWASALAFAWMHVAFRNPWAVALTLPSGWWLGRTWRQTRSLFVCTIEHTLYGFLVFTLGAGTFFYRGTESAARTIATTGRISPAPRGLKPALVRSIVRATGKDGPRHDRDRQNLCSDGLVGFGFDCVCDRPDAGADGRAGGLHGAE